MRRVFIIVLLVLIPVIPVVLVVTGVIKRQPTQVGRVNLTVWVTDDKERAALTNLAKNFRTTHPYVVTKVEFIRTEDFSTRLIQAWAQGSGPDIFFVPNTSIGAMEPYAAPMPNDLTIPVVTTTKGLFGTQTKIEQPVTKAPSQAQMREWYVDAAIGDIIRENQIWGLPLAMDTVVTYVNKDLLNNARVFSPAKIWDDVIKQIRDNQLTVIDDANTIVQSGAALGTADNVPYATDILTLLMMQNGSTMIDQSTKRVRFNDQAGLDALNFYTSFAQSTKETYSWNIDQPNARDAFLKGRVAYFFGSYADRAVIEKSGLNWSVAPMLHVSERGDKDGPSGNLRFISTARYRVGMVSKSAATAKRSTTAWSLLRYFANSGNVPSYLATTNQLSGLKAILEKQRAEPAKSVFAEQLLTARSWYRGRNALKAEEYISQMISSVVKDNEDPKKALDLAAKQVEATL